MQIKLLPDRYDPKEAEPRWQQSWFSCGVYHWQNDTPREQTFVIDTPPPTVSGHLHMGHVFSYVQADIIARYQRMSGKDVFYPMGFDDNGLPTERLVEKERKKRASDYPSREAFIAACEEVSEQARKDFRNLFQRLALSVDWRQEYHTISEPVRALSQQSFIELFEQGHIERRLQPMLWDPVDQTAIAQAEIVDKELPSHFNNIRFGIEDSDETITIATTRPELIPACVAIFYHPEDARYRHLKGKQAITPLFGTKVPILEDDTVEPDKGTGIMMCCTFGDEADIEKWRKHKLETRIIINKYGKIDLTETSSRASAARDEGSYEIPPSSDDAVRNDALEKLQNKKVSNPDPKHPGARQIILELLRESGDLLESTPITHTVKCAERSGAPLEILPTHQWFVIITDKKDALLARTRELNWYPDWMRLRMEQWIEGLNWDWCISRQRYYGVPFPVWYSRREGEEGKLLLPKPEQLPVNPLTDLPDGYSREEVIPDADVMDTWATSSLSPQINAGAISDIAESMSAPALSPSHRGGQETGAADRYKKLFPADLRPQAHEIIRTWAFYTLVKSHLHAQSLPWRDVMISGWCLAEDKTKMSKSKGNVITPLDLIDQHGTDAIRYWAATSRLGQDTAFSPDLLKIGRKLITKIWNATKFAAIHLEKLPEDFDTTGESDFVTEALDRWILTRLHRCIKKSTEAFKKYEFADALRATEDFFWNDFCDNYLELVKKRVYDEAGANPAGQRSAATAIAYSLKGILSLFAPFIPHITEELHAHLFQRDHDNSGSLHARGSWLAPDHLPCDANAERQGMAAVEILNTIRKAKSEKGVSIKYPIKALLIAVHHEDAPTLEPILDDLAGAGNIAEIKFISEKRVDCIATEHDNYLLELHFARQAEAG